MMFAERMDSKDTRFWYNGTNITDVDQNQSPENYMLIFDDIDQYFNKINLSNDSDLSSYDRQVLNCNYVINTTNITCPGDASWETYHNYWALVLVLFPIFTLFGNVLVILSVYRERTLQTATNYFIVSLALADLLVAVVVMPFAVYVLVSTKF
ncbi:hypothetical protein NQ314_001941 [Rhamnusium bicolor]|uniref:G-protein coupled receptors family 1 profile domain-containing protein n=1 Tax=Rhamnusium bicolor TaxID=1586634 RepID=A0AAV8ZSS2_9CUCU|nr:hypothetical protein NQ314_001941 [Rhamnusium bicolor]